VHLCKYLAAYLVSAGSRLDSVVVVLHRSASLSGRCHLLYTPIHLGVAARLSVTRLDAALVLVDAITDPSTTSPTNRFGNTTVDSAPNRFANRFLHTLSVLVARRNVEHVAAHAAKSRSESNLATISTTTSRGNSFARTRSLSRVVLVVETTSSITTSSPSIARASNRLDRRAFVVVVVSVPTASVVVPVVPSASRARSFAASVATPSSTANPRAVEHTVIVAFVVAFVVARVVERIDAFERVVDTPPPRVRVPAPASGSHPSFSSSSSRPSRRRRRRRSRRSPPRVERVVVANITDARASGRAFARSRIRIHSVHALSRITFSLFYPPARADDARRRRGGR